MSNFTNQTLTLLLIAMSVMLILNLVFDILLARSLKKVKRNQSEAHQPDPTDANQVIVAGGASGVSYVVIDDELRPLVERRNELRRRVVIRNVQEETRQLEQALGAKLLSDNTMEAA